MHNLPDGHAGANRPLFAFEGPSDLPATAIPKHQLQLSGPSKCLDAANWPVRGDLAHVRLAGICFVPHYAVPMPHTVAASGSTLRQAGREDAAAIVQVSGGAGFNVLDMSGGWAWGQLGDDGLVGYLPLGVLVAT